MKKIIFFTLLLAACSQEDSSNAIAEVNGEAITKSEIEKTLANFTGLPHAKLENYPADFQKEFVNKYIEKQLIVEDARKSGFDRDEEIQAKLKEAEDFLIEQKLLADIMKADDVQEKLQKLYDDEVKSLEGQEEARASHILVKTEAEAKDIKKKLNAGGNFAKLAQEFSKDPGSKINGGDLGFFTAEKMVPEFSKAAFALKKGQISEPVKSDFGWHIIRLDEKRQIQLPTFEQAKPALQKEFARRSVEDKLKQLKADADIEITYDFPVVESKPKEQPKAEDKAEDKAEKKADKK